MVLLIEKLKGCFAKKEKNVMKSLQVTFQKSQKLLAANLHERRSIQNFKGGLLSVPSSVPGRRAVSVIFEK